MQITCSGKGYGQNMGVLMPLGDNRKIGSCRRRDSNSGPWAPQSCALTTQQDRMLYWITHVSITNSMTNNCMKILWYKRNLVVKCKVNLIHWKNIVNHWNDLVEWQCRVTGSCWESAQLHHDGSHAVVEHCQRLSSSIYFKCWDSFNCFLHEWVNSTSHTPPHQKFKPFDPVKIYFLNSPCCQLLLCVLCPALNICIKI